ncbi:MAG: hypothetical protein ABJN98_12275 [Roseibium sp.]|uniref:hypothetical protein n=1 Tax=Roseibium polysiphoniae TaxID=2571221 RepID=UPI00329A554A
MILAKILSWMLGSSTGAILIAASVLAGGLFLWHKIDKSSAVRSAVIGFVAKVELSAAEEELKAVKLRNVALTYANNSFSRRMSAAEALQSDQAQELETYVSTVDGIVDRSLLERLPNR